jgi:hypothetical protein
VLLLLLLDPVPLLLQVQRQGWLRLAASLLGAHTAAAACPE